MEMTKLDEEEDEADSGLSVLLAGDLQDVDSVSGPMILPPSNTHPLLKDTSPSQQYTC